MHTETQFNRLNVQREVNRDLIRNADLEFPMDLYIKKVKREGKTRAIVSFTFKTVTNPEFASFTVSGTMSMDGKPAEIEEWITPVGSEPPKIWQHVYKETVAILAIMAQAVNTPFPVAEIEAMALSH